MKEKIMDKLFNNIELTNEEMIFIGKNLIDSPENSLKFDHDNADVLEACSVTKEDFDTLNKVMEVQMEDCKDKNGKSFSRNLESFEKIALTSPKFLRIILMNHIKLLTQSKHPLLSLLLRDL